MIIGRSHIITLTFGIRYTPSFGLCDNIGSVFDYILNDESSPFSTEFFPKFNSISTIDKALVHEELENYLRMSNSDLIFQFNIPDDKEDINKEIDWFQKDAVYFLVEKIVKKFNIEKVTRIGFMVTHKIDEENVGGKIIGKLTDKIDIADQFSLSFARKEPLSEGILKKGVGNYINKITTIKQISKENFNVTLDYQQFFEPKCDNLYSFAISDFFTKAYSYLDNQFYNFISELILFLPANLAVE